MSFLTDVTHLRDSDNQEWRPDDRSTDSTRAMTAAFNSNSPVAEVARSALQPHPSVDLTNIEDEEDDFAGISDLLGRAALEFARIAQVEDQTMVAQARENLSRRVEAILVTAGLRPEKVQIQYDIKNPGEAKDFLEEVLNRLKNQIRKYNRITEKSRDFRSLLPFFKNHTAHPDLVRSYACFMRLLPRIQKTVQPNDMEDLLKEVHRCLKIGLQTRRLTSTQFFEICLGLGVYCDLQNEELSREIFDILSPRLKFLPFTLSIPYEVSLKDIIPALMFLLNVKHLHGEKISRAMQEVDIRDQQLMAVERRAFVKEVNWFARTLVSKLNFAEEQIEPRFQRELFICLRALGYTDKEIGRVMLGNNPAKDSGNGGREVVPGARGGALPQFVYPAGSQANRAGGGACAGP